MSQPSPFENFRVLVIEDDAKCLREAHKFFNSLVLPFQIHVSYVRTLQEALPLLPQMTGVICDLYFPTSSLSGEVEANSRLVVDRCIEIQIPVLLVKNGVHDEQDLPDGISGRILSLLWKSHVYRPFMFEYRLASEELTARWTKHSKPWEQAFYGLLYLLHGVHQGAFQMNDCGVVKLERPTYDGEYEARWEGREVLEDWNEAHSHLNRLCEWAWQFTRSLTDEHYSGFLFFRQDRITHELREIVKGKLPTAQNQEDVSG